MILYAAYCLVTACIAMFLEVKYPNKYWIGCLLWLFNPATCHMYVATKAGYFVTLFFALFFFPSTTKPAPDAVEGIIFILFISLAILLFRIKGQKSKNQTTKEPTQ